LPLEEWLASAIKRACEETRFGMPGKRTEEQEIKVMLMNKAESLLKDIGMKEYEAKAFTSIVKCGTCSAEQINKMSRIPLTRVYETMQSLQKLGIVTVLNTRPKKYKLISVDAINNIIEHKKKLMQQELERSGTIIKEIKSLIPKNVAENPEEMREGLWIFKGRETAIRKIMERRRTLKGRYSRSAMT